MEKHILNWFEIPVQDFIRAKKFYETILDREMPVEKMDGYKMAFFPFYNDNPTGCITEDPSLKSSNESGILIYFNGDPDLTKILNKVEEAGGKILIHKTMISPEYGFYAIFLDSEGNKVGVQSIG